jgi:YesN/AraC family two-component response regulator
VSVPEQLAAVCSDYETQKRRTRTALSRHVPGLIRQLMADGLSLRQIARGLKRSPTYISQIMNEQQRPSVAVSAALARLAIERMRHES